MSPPRQKFLDVQGGLLLGPSEDKNVPKHAHFRRNDQIEFHFDVTFAILLRFARESIIWTPLSELFRFWFS